MKRIFLLLSTVALLSMVSCGSSAEGSKDGAAKTKTEKSESCDHKGGRKENKGKKGDGCCSEVKTTDCSAKADSCCTKTKSTDCSAQAKESCQGGECSAEATDKK